MAYSFGNDSLNNDKPPQGIRYQLKDDWSAGSPLVCPQQLLYIPNHLISHVSFTSPGTWSYTINKLYVDTVNTVDRCFYSWCAACLLSVYTSSAID